MAKQVGVETTWDAGLGAAIPNELSEPGLGQPALLANPERCQVGRRVLGSSSKVAIDGADRLCPDRDESGPAALSGDSKEALLEVDVGHRESENLGPAAAGVHEDAED